MLNEIPQGYTFSHTALHKGYISRRNKKGIISVYKGRYGEGYTIDRPNWKSNNYSFRDYYIKKDTMKFELMDLNNYTNVAEWNGATEELAIQRAFLIMECRHIYAAKLTTIGEDDIEIGTTNLVLKIK